MWHPPCFLVVFAFRYLTWGGFLISYPFMEAMIVSQSAFRSRPRRHTTANDLNLHFGSAGSSHHATTCPFLDNEGGWPRTPASIMIYKITVWSAIMLAHPCVWEGTSRILVNKNSHLANLGQAIDDSTRALMRAVTSPVEYISEHLDHGIHGTLKQRRRDGSAVYNF